MVSGNSTRRKSVKLDIKTWLGSEGKMKIKIKPWVALRFLLRTIAFKLTNIKEFRRENAFQATTDLACSSSITLTVKTSMLKTTMKLFIHNLLTK
jgi:hypothetical protein